MSRSAHRTHVVMLLATVTAGVLFLVCAPRDFFETNRVLTDAWSQVWSGSGS